VVATPLYEKNKKQLEKRFKVRLEPFSPFIVSRNMSFHGPKYLLYAFLFSFHLLKLLRRERFDLIFARNGIIGGSIKLLKPFIKTPTAISYTDFLSLFLLENPYYPKFLVRFLYRIEKSIAKSFDKVFVITPKMKKELLRAGVNARKVIVSFDGVDTKLFNPEKVSRKEMNQAKKKTGFSERIVLFHGTIEHHHGLALFKEIIERTLSKTKANFLIIGSGPGFNELKKKLSNKNVKFLGFVEHSRLPAFLSIASVGIIPYRKNPNLDMVLTLKLLEYLAMGKPVVSTELESVKEIFGAYDFIRISKNPEEFSENISFFLNKVAVKNDSVKLIQKNFSWDSVNEKICKEVEKLK
jgi:glycosyltransferase involved in cell wall biosynthesis